MNAQSIIDRLTEKDIIKLMTSLGSLYPRQQGNALVFQSVCHQSTSWKLWYYHDTRRFQCYSNCGNLSVFDVIMKTKNISFKESVEYLKETVNTIKPRHGIGHKKTEFVPTPLEDVIVEELPQIDKPFLYNVYSNKEIKEWCDEGIIKEVQEKFNIRYNVIENQAIIPHFNTKNECIGIRVREFDKIKLLKGSPKYHPLWYSNKCYSHSLGQSLYGFHISKENIVQYKIAYVFESEKSCMLYESYYPNKNLSVATCGSSFSLSQKKMLINCGVEEIVIALDRQYESENSNEAIEWKNKILKMSENLLDYCKVSYIWDTDKNRYLDYKSSPIDHGKEIFELLAKNRILINRGD